MKLPPALQWIGNYAHWLHTRWPAGIVEKLPEAGEDGATQVPGLRIVGDLTGIPLLKFAADTGARAVQAILREPGFRSGQEAGMLDVAIVGASVSGIAAAIEARKAGLHFEVYEATQPFSTIVNFPKAKPIFTYPTDFKPAGDLHVGAEVKEALIDELENQRISHGIEVVTGRVEKVVKSGAAFDVVFADGSRRQARRVVVAIGRSGNFRKLGVPGEELDKVSNRLHDPKDFLGKDVLVVGGGDSALEAAIALAACGSHVTLSYRKKEFARPKPENIERIQRLQANPAAAVSIETPTSERVTTAASSEMRGSAPPGSLRLAMATSVQEIRENEVVLRHEDVRGETLPNDAVFAMIGREAPLDFFRRSGVKIRGEWQPLSVVSLILFLLACVWLYHWKASYALPFQGFALPEFLTPDPARWWQALRSLNQGLNDYLAEPTTLGHTVMISASSPGFYYTLAYSLCVAGFGFQRMARRRTPYVKAQTFTLMAIQVVPLFLLPEIFLPWAGYHGLFDSGAGKSVADALFPEVSYGHGREYWRAYGFVLAFPLFVGNWFTPEPLWAWLAIGGLQTFVLIPILIYYYGKGAYCGWICSCGALAETMGDAHRHKMPHGPFWNRLNMLGQVFLAFAVLLLFLRVLGWAGVGPAAVAFDFLFKKIPIINYEWMVDLLWAGILGVGLYFWFSGRVWCRFACPLAALMHIYARFSSFRIFAEKKKCISCNVCTSVCHQGIDIMNFANKGLPMEDPECVRCSACVQSCPTGVLTFGRLGTDGKPIFDTLPASLTQMAETKPKAS
jgi:thioredoxin reductase/ferredoxin